MEEDEKVWASVSATKLAPIRPWSSSRPNNYMHYVFDLWADRWRRQAGRGKVIIVRFADDFVVGFQNRTDAEQFQTDLRARQKGFNLELHADKTRLIEFGLFAAAVEAGRC